jgi:hypothetical protein
LNQEQIRAFVQRYQAEAADAIPLSLRVQVLRQLLQYAEVSTGAPKREVWEPALDAMEELLNTGQPWTKAGEDNAETLRNYLRVASGDQVIALVAEVAALALPKREVAYDLVGAAARARLAVPRGEGEA